MNKADHAFQFHCMICYDEFENEGTRYPVVLPCGHTYVCKRCGDRLDKCMECREPLYMTFVPETNNAAPTPPSSISARPYWSSARSSSTTASSYNSRTQPKGPRDQKPMKKRLPLPKNVVLLSLIDATQLASGDRQSILEEPICPGIETMPSTDATSGGVMSKLEADEEEENQRAQFATSVSAGIAGTYAVAVQEGLQIFPKRPPTLTRSSSVMTDEDVDSLVHKVKQDQNSLKGAPDSIERSSSASDDTEMAHLVCGDRIQVVSVEQGWAKLARGYGFVRADKNQIVKVMNALDRACILEAILKTMSAERRRLRTKQTEHDTQFVKLMNQLQDSLKNDEDFTVVCRSAFHTDENEESAEFSNGEESPTEKKEGDKPSWTFSREPSAVATFASTLTPIEPNVPVPNSCRLPSPVPNVIRAGALAWRERQAREVQKSINFRSGLSGHMALASSRAHPHELLSATSSDKSQNQRIVPSNLSLKVTNFRMSSHSGLTLSHRKKPSPSSRRTPNLDSIKLSGSM